jgi:electron transfer flavoprotein beta subunit
VEIIACIKQIPDTESQIKINSTGAGIVTDDIKWVMNPYDEYGVEEALRLKEKFGGNVIVVSVGPKRATEAIRTALAMGADKGVLVSDDAALNGDAYATAKVLAAAIKGMPYDIIFCGQRAVDDDSATVGATLAEFLGIPQLTIITKVEVDPNAKKLVVNRPVEGGTMVIESSLPAVVTAQKGLNEPRYASLPGIMKAKKKPLDEKTLADLGVNPSEAGVAGSKTKIIKLTPPPQRKAGRIIEGETPAEKASSLVKLLHEEAKVV